MAGPPVIGVIGGSGLDQINGLAEIEWRRVESPFGRTSDEFCFGTLDGHPVVFVPRHGRGHVLPPSEIDFRATESDVAIIYDFNHAAWNSETHENLPYIAGAKALVSCFQRDPEGPLFHERGATLPHCHHHLAQRNSAIVRGHSLVRIHLEPARLQQRRGPLRQVAILKYAAAEHNLLWPGSRRDFQNPLNQRVVELRCNSGNGHALALIFYDLCDQRSPIPIFQRIRFFRAQRTNFIFE